MPPGTGAKAARLVELDLTTGQTANVTTASDLSEYSPSYLDGHQVVYVSGKLNSPDYAPELKLLDLSTGQVRTLSKSRQFVRSASSSPSPPQVIYDAFASGGGSQLSLWSVSLEGKAPVQLTGAGFTWPSVDSSGHWILVTEVGSPQHPGALRLLPVKPVDK
jgi:Tol biopolymer transport system component